MALSSRPWPATRAIPGYYNGTLAHHAYMQRDYRRAEVLMRQVSLEKFPLYHFVGAIIYAQLGHEARGRRGAGPSSSSMRPTFFDQWDQEVAMRNYRPEDGAHLGGGRAQGRLSGAGRTRRKRLPVEPSSSADP